MKRTSSPWIRAVKVFFLLLLPVATWWWSWRYYAAQKDAEARESAQRWLDQVQLQLEESQKNVNQAVRKLAEADAVMKGAKQPQIQKDLDRDIIRQKLQERKSIEFGTVSNQRRTSWNGQTDPDAVWYGQRQSANQTLIQHGLPTLEGKGKFPDTVTPSRPIFRQK